MRNQTSDFRIPSEPQRLQGEPDHHKVRITRFKDVKIFAR